MLFKSLLKVYLFQNYGYKKLTRFKASISHLKS